MIHIRKVDPPVATGQWWMQVRVPGAGDLPEWHLYPIDDPDGDGRTKSIKKVKDKHKDKIPDDGWFFRGGTDGIDISVYQGDPHPSILAVATVHDHVREPDSR